MTEGFPSLAKFYRLHGPRLRPSELVVLVTLVSAVVLTGLYVATGGRVP